MILRNVIILSHQVSYIIILVFLELTMIPKNHSVIHDNFKNDNNTLLVRKINLSNSGITIECDYIPYDYFWAIDNVAYLTAIEECSHQSTLNGQNDLASIIKLSTCRMACTMKKLGTMGEDGSYLVEKIITDIPEDRQEYTKIVSELRKCGKLELASDECDSARNIRDCVLKNVPCSTESEWGCTSETHSYLFNVH